jgi:hypothetical protein
VLYDLTEEHIYENIGRGLRGKVTKQDKLMIVLCYLKHYETLDKMADTFSMSKSNLQHILSVVIEAIEPILYQKLVVEIQEYFPEDEEEESPELFPEAKYVMDATFQTIWTPTGTFAEQKRYYSGKHKAYMQASGTLLFQLGLTLEAKDEECKMLREQVQASGTLLFQLGLTLEAKDEECKMLREQVQALRDELEIVENERKTIDSLKQELAGLKEENELLRRKKELNK